MGDRSGSLAPPDIPVYGSRMRDLSGVPENTEVAHRDAFRRHLGSRDGVGGVGGARGPGTLDGPKDRAGWGMPRPIATDEPRAFVEPLSPARRRVEREAGAAPVVERTPS